MGLRNTIRQNLFDRLVGKDDSSKSKRSWLHSVTGGSFYKTGDIFKGTDLSTITAQIKAMRALARDSQISTALSYYATDSTVPNAKGDIIWASPTSEQSKDVADIVNLKLREWNVNSYARDHILELATIGNLYIPTTDCFDDIVGDTRGTKVALNNNSVPGDDYDIIPSMKLEPENVTHLYKDGQPYGYIVDPDEEGHSEFVVFPESSIIHFSLGGLLGEYSINLTDSQGNVENYDIQFAQPLMERAMQPTQTLSLLENAMLLSSLSRVIRFVALDLGNISENEVMDNLMELKAIIENQFSLNTNSGDMESFMNPQSPNNLIYLPKVNGSTPIDIVSLEMADTSEADNKLLDYYQDKKLSVLGVPKEAMNFSSNEGLGGAGSVLSQRSALYANALARLTTAYKSGWKSAIDHYFKRRNVSGFTEDCYVLHMQPIITPMSDVLTQKRDSSISQAQQLIDMLKSLHLEDDDAYKSAAVEAIVETFPDLSALIAGKSINMNLEEDDTVGL